MKRGVLLLILLLLPLVSGLYEKKVYNGWVPTNKWFTIEGENYSFEHRIDRNESIAMLPGDVSVWIKPEIDPCADVWIYRVCQTKAKYMIRNIEVTPDMHSELNVSLYLSINKTESSLNITRTILPNESYIGEPFKVTVKLDKIGPLALMDIKYTDPFPSTFLVSPDSNCYVSNNTIVWSGDLNLSDSATFSYTVRPTINITYGSTASANYTVMNRSQLKTHKYNFKVTDAPVILTLSKPNISRIGRIDLVNVTIKAYNPVYIKQFRMSLPEKFQLSNKSPDFILRDGALVLENLNMERGAEKRLYLNLSTNYSGNHTLNAEVQYTINNEIKELERSTNLQYYQGMFGVVLYTRNESKVMRIFNHEDYGFKEMQIITPTRAYGLPFLGPKRFKEFELNTTGNNLTINISYKSEFGQPMTADFLIPIQETQLPQENITDLPQELVIPTPTPKPTPKQEFKMPDIDSSIFIYIGIGVLVMIILVAAVAFIKSRSTSSQIEKEIKELEKKQDKTDDKMQV